MENLLIEIYLFVCHLYDTSSATCYQRLSNNREPLFTDQELITIWFFAHFDGLKKPKGKELAHAASYYNRLVRSIRQPIESLFNWIEEKTGIQKAGKVRSTDALMIHRWGKLAVAFFLLVFNY
jgi:hypothetical protein